MSGLPNLSARWMGKNLLCFDTLSSTNDYLKENATELSHGTAVTAVRQTAGRGRRGKGWETGGLAMSVLLHGLDSSSMQVLPLLAGLAVAEATQEATGYEALLKWSNDVLLGGKKICGILCESRIAGDKAFAVVGMGVNLSQTRAQFDRLGLVYATSLELATGKIVGVLPLAGMICNHFEPILEEFRQNGFVPLKARYLSRCVTLNREIRVIIGNTERRGVAVDIADDGALICEIDGRLELVYAGEASVRGIYGYV